MKLLILPSLFPLWCSSFLSGSECFKPISFFFFLQRTSFNIFCNTALLAKKFLQFCFEKIFFCLLCFEKIFIFTFEDHILGPKTHWNFLKNKNHTIPVYLAMLQNSRLVVFPPLNTFKIFTPLSSSFHGFWKVGCYS